MTLSINTNTAAMAALESLSATSNALTTTENEVSTGKKVSSASDNPAIYAISQQMTGNIAGLSAVSDSLSLGAQVVATASKASADVISTLQSLQQTVTQAGQTGIDTSTMQTQVASALNLINTYARNSTFNGVNLLTSSADANSGTGGTPDNSATLNVVSGLQGTTISIGNQAVATKAGAFSLTDALGLTSGMTGGETVLPQGSGVAGTSVVQSILTSGASGVNMSVGSTLTAAGSFTDGNAVVLTNGDGSTTTFEFDSSSTAAATKDTATNHTVTVTVDSANQSSNQMLGALVSSMNANGYNAITQSDGSINVTGQGLKASSSTVTGLNSGTTLSAGTAVINTLQSAIQKMTSISSTLGNATQVITGVQSFTSDLSDALTSGVGALTDADLSATSAKLTSLQTKQQLAIQSLSIANSQSSSILSLFRS